MHIRNIHKKEPTSKNPWRRVLAEKTSLVIFGKKSKKKGNRSKTGSTAEIQCIDLNKVSQRIIKIMVCFMATRGCYFSMAKGVRLPT